MSETDENAKKAFAGESQARNKYTFFAEKAEEEGKGMVARLFRAVAEAEKVHARNHAEAMGMIGDTAENIKDAIDGENYEHTEMYPKFHEKAQEEGETEMAQSFKWALDVEKVHEKLYRKALERVREGEDMEEERIFVCQTCGNTVEEEAPSACPICGSPRQMFEEVK